MSWGLSPLAITGLTQKLVFSRRSSEEGKGNLSCQVSKRNECYNMTSLLYAFISDKEKYYISSTLLASHSVISISISFNKYSVRESKHFTIRLELTVNGKW